MIELPEGLDRSIYPLAWFVGEFTGSGKLGGNFGVQDAEFEASTTWESAANTLKYSQTLTVDGKPYVSEEGVWKVAESRPETLLDELQFPIEAEISTTWHAASTPSTSKAARATNESTRDDARDDAQSDAENANVNARSWTTKYVGLVGYGKAELLSDEIALHTPDGAIGDFQVNDLFRSKRIFGWVNNRILWAWDIALIGAHSGAEDELKSIAAGGLWK